jgi:hypothetical protein
LTNCQLGAVLFYLYDKEANKNSKKNCFFPLDKKRWNPYYIGAGTSGLLTAERLKHKKIIFEVSHFSLGERETVL